jgi:lipopolysaccharide/colanic/teichoic acid biosynthesis glycosyltransferase
LPQLWNVVKGEMSLVGPRPDLLNLEDYTPAQLRRFEVLPGITGLWQINEKNEMTFNEMIELDIEYVDTKTLLLDLKILFSTAFGLLKFSNS